MNDSLSGKRRVLLPILALTGSLTAIILLMLFLLPTQPGQASQGGIILRPGVDSPTLNVITIGVAADLSQIIPDMGWRQVNSVVLLASQINAQGGIEIGGVAHDIVVAIADSECTNATASQAAANALVSQGAVAVVGHTCSNSSLAAQPIYAAANIAMVSASSTGPFMTESGFSNFLRVITRDDSPPARLGIYLYKHMGYHKVAVVEMSYGNTGLSDPFINSFTGLGGVISTRYTLSDPSEYAATVTSIAGEGVDAILYNGPNGAVAGEFSLAADNGGLTTIPVAWISGEFDLDLLDDYLSAAGVAAENDLAMLHYRDQDNMPLYTAYNTDYLAQSFPNYGDEGQEWGAFAYDAAHMIINAIQTADSTNPADILTAMHNAGSHSGVVGEYYGFDAKGDVLPQWMWFGGVRNSRWTELLSVGLSTDGPDVDDNGFNESVYAGILQAQSEDLVISTVYTAADPDEYQPDLELCAQDGNQLCIAVGFLMTEAVTNAALAHPETMYTIMDADITDATDNLRSYDFAEDEAGYLAGSLAGLMTSSDVVGAVGGMSSVPAVVDFLERYGHAAVCANPSATTILTYTETFVDPDLGAQTAADQMALGADVIFGAAGPTGNGAILYAAQNGAYAIGVDMDQYLTVFDSGAEEGSEMLLSSAMKRLDNAAYDAITDLIAGAFTPGMIDFNLENDGVGLAPFHETEAIIPDYVKIWLAFIEDQIISGDLDIYGACLTPKFVYLPTIVR